jgi:hypothetical protein
MTEREMAEERTLRRPLSGGRNGYGHGYEQEPNVWTEVVQRLHVACSEIGGTLSQASDRKMPTADLQAVEAALSTARRNSKARQFLSAATKREPEPQIPELEAALDDARAANIPSDEVKEAEDALALARIFAVARETLRAACARMPEPVVDELEKALIEAREANLPDHDSNAPQAALDLAKRRVLVRQSALVACDRKPEPIVEDLEATLREAMRVSISRPELRDLETARDRAKCRAAARQVLQVACAQRPEASVDQLQAALRQAKAIDIPNDELQPAEAALAQATCRAAAREALRAACEREPEFLVEELEAALSQSREASLPTLELEEGIAALALAKLRVAAREAIRAACASHKPSMEALRAALDLAREAKIPHREVQEAKAAVLLAQRAMMGLAPGSKKDAQPCIPRDQWSFEWQWE